MKRLFFFLNILFAASTSFSQTQNWDNINTSWDDPIDGNDSRDLTKFGVTSDATKLYLYFTVAANYNKTTSSATYPEIAIYIDTDNNLNTGLKDPQTLGTDIKLTLIGPNLVQQYVGGAVAKELFNPNGTANGGAIWLTNNATSSWFPQNNSSPDFNFFELSYLFSDLGLSNGRTLRFFVESRWTGDFIGNNSSMSNSIMTYNLTKINWNTVSTVWKDIQGDQATTSPATEDLTKFGVTTDAQKMYFYFETAQIYNQTSTTGNYPEVNFYIDTDLNSSTGLNNPSIPEGKGAEVKVVMVGANSGTITGGAIYLEKYNSKGVAIPTGSWIANGVPSTCPTCNSWLPRNKDNNINFMEAALNLSDLGITKDNPVRLMVMSRWANDYIGANNTMDNSNLYYEMPRAPIQIDGANTDWRYISTQWKDSPSDLGGAQNDLKSFAVTSDNTNLYFSFNMEKPYDLTYNYPELLVYIDTDNNAATGTNGAEIALDFLVASANYTPKGQLRRVVYGKKDNWFTDGSLWQPKYTPHNSAFTEFYLPLSDLELAPGTKIRFYVQERWSNDFIGNNNSITNTNLTYTLGSSVALDGNEDDWDLSLNKREWIDPDNDAGNNERDLSIFSLSQDKDNLNIYFKVAKSYTNLHPEVEIYFDNDNDINTGIKDLSNPNNPLIGADILYALSGASSELNSQGGGYFSVTGQTMRRVYDTFGRQIGIDEFSSINIAPNFRSHTKDFMEVSIPLSKLKLIYGQKFRFFVRERFSGDILGQNSSISNSRLTFPSETVYIGALTNLNTDYVGTINSTEPDIYKMNLDKILAGNYLDEKGSTIKSYSEAIMGQHNLTYKSGNYFDVQLSMATDINFISQCMSKEDNTSNTIQNTNFDTTSYDFSINQNYLNILKTNRITCFPLINYHYLNNGRYKWFLITENDKPRDCKGVPLGGNFLPISPNHPKYISTTAINFTKATIESFKPYLGETINEVYVGNEVIYPNSDSHDRITSFDTYSESLWKNFEKNVNFINAPDFQNLTQQTPFNKFTPDLWKFRSRRLINLFNQWSYTAYNQSGNKIRVSTKLVPYSFYGDVFYLSAGYFPYIFDYLNDNKIKTIAIDSYVGTGSSNSNDLLKSYRLNKPISLSEFNCPENSKAEASNSLNASKEDIQRWILNGVTNYNVRSASLFGWNIGTNFNGTKLGHMTDNQKEGLKNSVNAVISLNKPLKRTKLVRAIIPIELDFVLPNCTTYVGAIPDVNNYFLGFQKIGTKCQELNKEVGFEIDYSTKDVQPDLTIKTIAQSCTLTTNELKNKKTIYLVRDKNTKIYILNSNDGTINSISVKRDCASNSKILLSNNQFSLSIGETLIDWTSEWNSENGNFLLPINQTNLKILAKTFCGDENAIIKIENTVFFSSDILTYIGTKISDSQSENSSQFMSELIKKMIYNEDF